MYQCKNCGGNLKFHIESQMLKCNYCGQSEDPAGFIAGRDADEHRIKDGEYEVTVFTCSQCGAEIISDDTTAATFCNYCGGTAILDSRLSHEKCPALIIPFKKSKEDCKAAYQKLMKKAIFAPGGMKKTSNIESFRGIYMPYWAFDYIKKGNIEFVGSSDGRQGDYIVFSDWNMTANVDIEYRNILYDASLSFSDSISRAITPFEMNEALPFTPAYLSGFYADTSDIASEIYLSDMKDSVCEEFCSRLEKKANDLEYKIDRESLLNNFDQVHASEKLVLLPVWFLSYRNKDRICYSVINGQTGKAVSDLPVVPWKYLLGSLILTIPLFFIFNLLFSLRALPLMILATFFLLISCVFSFYLKKEIRLRESDQNGIMPQKETSKKKERKKQPIQTKTSEKDDVASNLKIKYNRKKIIAYIFLSISAVSGCILIIIGFTAMLAYLPFLVDVYEHFVFVPMLLCIGWYCLCLELSKRFLYQNSLRFPDKERRIIKQRLEGGDIFITLLKPLLGILSVVITLIGKPFSIIYHYSAVCFILVLILWTVLSLIQEYNQLTTRKLPQFNQRGGEENE